MADHDVIRRLLAAPTARAACLNPTVDMETLTVRERLALMCGLAWLTRMAQERRSGGAP